MSATVLGCGHTSHLNLFTVDAVVSAPQVHLHFLTDDGGYEQLGYAKVELCCHGCGASTLIYYTNTDKPDRRVQLRNDFVRAHRRCPNRNYQSGCPDWRSSFKTIDIRRESTAALRRVSRSRPQKDAALLTVTQAAERLGLSKSSVYRLCATGALPHRKVAGTIRFEVQAIKAVAEGRRS